MCLNQAGLRLCCGLAAGFAFWAAFYRALICGTVGLQDLFEIRGGHKYFRTFSHLRGQEPKCR